MIRLKHASFFLISNLIVITELLLALRFRFYLRQHGVSELSVITMILATSVSIFLTLWSLWTARSLIIKETMFDRAKPKLLVLSFVFGWGLSGVLLAIDEILKWLP